MLRIYLIFTAFLINTSIFSQCYRNIPAGNLNNTEISSLQFLREEELMARDVYHALSKKYDIPVFRNIANSEERHTSSILGLLEKYQIEDPAADHKLRTELFTPIPARIRIHKYNFLWIEMMLNHFLP